MLASLAVPDPAVPLMATTSSTTTITARPRPVPAASTGTAAPSELPVMATVQADGLNVRACPGIECIIIAWLGAGDMVEVEACSDGWAQVRQGWVRSRYTEPDACK